MRMIASYMIKILRNTRSRSSQLRSLIFDELIVSRPLQSAQFVVDELGLAMATHPGYKRNRNEDRIAVARISAPNAETYTVALVCDGVGGSESGDQAAALAISSIVADLAQQNALPSLKELVDTLVRRADEHVRRELQGRGATTLVMLLTTASGHFVCANVGDSRAYSWESNSNKITQITTDDTIENELKDIPGNPEALIKARGLQGRLSQALGESGRDAHELRIQTYTKDSFHHGALLGTDGLWRAAHDFEITVANATTPIDAVRRAIALANWVGGVDNASVIAINDVDLLCNGQLAQDTANRWQMGITLWCSSTKVKILTSEWLSEINVVQIPSKSERPKRSVKKKDSRSSEDEPQLKLDSVDSKVARPKIEVRIGNEKKKSE